MRATGLTISGPEGEDIGALLISLLIGKVNMDDAEMDKIERSHGEKIRADIRLFFQDCLRQGMKGFVRDEHMDHVIETVWGVIMDSSPYLIFAKVVDEAEIDYLNSK